MTFQVRAPFSEFGHSSVRAIPNKKIYSYEKPTALFADKSTNRYESMVFVGDIMLARNVEYLMNSNGNEYPFNGFDLSLLAPSSAVFGNFEASIPIEHEETPAGSLTFSVKDSAADVIRSANITHLSLGNNHSFDYDFDGYQNTIDSLSRSQIETFGNEKSIDSDSIIYIDLNEEKVAVLGINLLVSLEEEELQNFVKHASKRSDIQIAYVHWGEEYDLEHSTTQEKQAKLMIEAGVDLIIGHHPHVTQDIGIIDGVPVFYSLGNYVFDQYFSKDVQEGLVLALTHNDGFAIEIIPVSSQTKKSQPNLMTPDKHVDFLASLARKSDEKLRGSIARGRIDLQESVASSTKMAIINQ